MKDQYFGDVNKLQQRFDMQLRKLARRWQVQGSSFTTDYQPVLAELFAEHRSNAQDRAHWTSASLQNTARALSSWVVISADHFPSRAHVICPSLFSMLLHKTFCTGEVFALCREPAASFRAEVVTMIPARLQHRFAWGLRLHAPLPTARILPKPTKDWLKARPIISFFRTWAAPLLTVFGALIFELTKVSFQFRSWYSSFGMLCRARTPRNIYSWYHKTYPVSSHPFPLNVFTKLFRFYSTAMIRW